MNRFTLHLYVSLILLFSTAGCTDFVEPNQLAFVVGSGIDFAEGGMVEVSHQIVIPSQLNISSKGEGSGNPENIIVLSAKGKDVFEANQKIQRKLSRRLMPSHRVMTAISEKYLNENDASKLFDKLNRDPANNQRSITLIIKGSAKELLKIKHPIERFSSIAAKKELLINGMRSFTMRRFIIDSVAEGNRPLMPVFQIENLKLSSKETTPFAVLSGFAVFNKKLKIQGFLDDIEGSRAIWMAGKGTSQGITIPWKDGKGNLSFRLTHLGRQIHSESGNVPKHIILTVKAQAYLLENTTSLDMSEVDNMIDIQKYVNKQIQMELQDTMDKVQMWGSDVFGIGEHLHRKYPYWWKSQRDNWDEKFKNIDVTVHANIKLRSIGASDAKLKY